MDAVSDAGADVDVLVPVVFDGDGESTIIIMVVTTITDAIKNRDFHWWLSLYVAGLACFK